MLKRKSIGNHGEQLVAEKLTREGFIILAHNYARRYGEIDLIAQKNDLLVFVEVKTRRSQTFDLTTVIVPSKQKKIIAVAKEFMATHAVTNKICRFDVALLEPDEHNQLSICYISNAFTEQE